MEGNNSKDTIFCTECNAEIPKDSKFCSECGKSVKIEPEKKSQNEENVCPKCHATIKPGLKFCTECGTKQEGEVSNTDKIICPKCHVEAKPGLRFCTECGTKLPESTSTVQPTTCPKCFSEVANGLRFCTECGTEIKKISYSNLKTCPKCHADVTPGLRFCTECGTSLKKRSVTSAEINEKLRQKREASNPPPRDENVDKLVTSGKGIVKELGGIFNKAVEDLDSMVKTNSNQKSEDRIKSRIKRKNNPGYLVCDECGGSYQLEKGESPEDFVMECECGGKLEFKQNI